MKELGMTDNEKGIESTFGDIIEISRKCKFPDCRHISETDCAVIEALDKGIIDRHSYENYLKIQKEQERFQMTIAEKRKKEKMFGKMIKNYFKETKKNKF